MQYAPAGILQRLALGQAKQRQVILQRFGVDQKACSIRLRILNDCIVEGTLHEKKQKHYFAEVFNKGIFLGSTMMVIQQHESKLHVSYMFYLNLLHVSLCLDKWKDNWQFGLGVIEDLLSEIVWLTSVCRGLLGALKQPTELALFWLTLLIIFFAKEFMLMNRLENSSSRWNVRLCRMLTQCPKVYGHIKKIQTHTSGDMTHTCTRRDTNFT